MIGGQPGEPRTRRIALRGRSRRAVWRRGVARRVLSGLLVGGAAWIAVSALAPPPPDPGPLVVVAARDIAVGEPISAANLTQAHVPEAAVPDGTFARTDSVSGVAAAPLRRGEIVTDLRVRADRALAGLGEGMVLAHVPLADPGIVSLVSTGQRVDVISTVDGTVVAADVVVVSAPEVSATYDGADRKAGVLVAVTHAQAGDLARAASPGLAGAGVTIVIRATP